MQGSADVGCHFPESVCFRRSTVRCPDVENHKVTDFTGSCVPCRTGRCFDVLLSDLQNTLGRFPAIYPVVLSGDR